MAALALMVTYHGLEALNVEVQCSLAPGPHNFNLMVLADKAAEESKERVPGALSSIGLALPL